MKVSVVRAADPNNSDELEKRIAEAVDLVGGLELFVKKGERVVLKPNLGVGRKVGVTSPSFIEGVIRQLQAAGCIPIVAEGSSKSVDYSSEAVFRITGVRDLCRRYGVDLIDLDDTETSWVTVKGGKAFKKMRLPKVIVESDRIINLPKLKTHHLTKLSCGLKNLQGVVPGYDKLLTHAYGLDQALVDINKAVKSSLTLVDGIVGMDGVGPFYGRAIPVGCILAGGDVVAVDAVACGIMGLEPREVRHLQIAFGDFGFDPGAVELVGVPPAQIATSFNVPSPTLSYLLVHRLMCILDRSLYARVSRNGSLFPRVSRQMGVHLRIDRVACDFCGACVEACQLGAIALDKAARKADILAACVDCMECMERCPKNAIRLSGRVKSGEMWKGIDRPA